MASNQLHGFPFHTSQMDITKSKVRINGTLTDLDDAFTSVPQVDVVIYPTGVIALDTAAIANAQSDIANTGGIVYLAEGNWSISGITPVSRVLLKGAGKATRLVLTGSVLYEQSSSAQLWGAGLCDCWLVADSASASATAILLKAANHNVFENLVFTGFTSGTILNISGEVVTLDTSDPFVTSNVVFNTFRTWRAISCANAIRIKGHYGSTPTASPANSANVPDHLVTANLYQDMIFWGVSTKGIDLIGACDSENFDWVTISLSSNGAILVDIASDATYTGNNYVNSHRFRIVATLINGTSTATLFKSGWTFGNHFDVEHDINIAGMPGITVFDMANSQSYSFTGKRLIDSLSNLMMTNISKGLYMVSGDGSAAAPTYSYEADPASGMYLYGFGQPALATSGLLNMRWNNVANAINWIDVVNNATGGAPRISAHGGDANVPIVLGGYGQEGGRLWSGNGSTKFHWNEFGVAFNGSSVIAKPTITGSRGGNAALSSLLTELANYGLITDGTSA